jgi:hypothetical protein
MSDDRPYRTAIIPTGAMTGTSVIHSQAFNIQQQQCASFQPKWTGTPTGTFTVEVSNDYAPNSQSSTPLNAGTWDNIGASISVNPSGSAGHTYIPIYASGAHFVRLTYTNASGSGVLGGMFNAKTRG